MLCLEKSVGESWFEAAIHYAKPYGLEHEVTIRYLKYILRGVHTHKAAYYACVLASVDYGGRQCKEKEKSFEDRLAQAMGYKP